MKNEITLEDINPSDGEGYIVENPDLLKTVHPDTEVKKFLVDYVGKKENPDNGEVSVEMIIKVLAEDFPEFLLPVAEENFIRGYQQALFDVETGQKMFEEKMNNR